METTLTAENNVSNNIDENSEEINLEESKVIFLE